MEKANKRKAKAVALATAAVLVLAGTIAYLADASGTIRNVFDNEHIRVQINESGITDSTTGANTDNGDKGYTVLPGTSESKDPTITVDTDTDAYVFAVVKDTINSHKATPESTAATKFVNYTIADGWVELDKANLAKKQNVKKYIDILNNKTEGNLTVDPTDENTRIYYRKVHGAESDDHSGADHRFTYNLLTNDQISYPTTLTNEDMNLLNGISDEEKKALIFQTWAIQMKPFCPDDEIAETDLEKADQKQYAKDAWNETTVVPTGVTVSQAESKTTVGIDKTLPLTATVTPKNAVDKTVTWESSNESIATVDENGVVTGVAEGGPVTITATANGASGVSGTYAVTVGPTFGYAVQFHGYDTNTSTVTFWPAMGPKAQGAITQGVSHNDDAAGCIHHDSWADIKANLATNSHYYDDCITNGCTKKVELDETAFTSTECGEATKTTGDGGGMVYDGLTYEEAMWDYTNNSAYPNDNRTYPQTLEKIKANSDLASLGAEMFLVEYNDLLASKTTNASRVIYRNSGIPYTYWLGTIYTDLSGSGGNGRAWSVRGSHPDYADGELYVLHKHDSFVTFQYGIAPGFSY